MESKSGIPKRSWRLRARSSAIRWFNITPLWLAWQESPSLGKLKFPHLADGAHHISRAYGVLIEDKGIALRGTFVIDPEGNLKHSTINDTAVGRNVDETIRTLAAFETGKLTGCNWTPGKKTLN